VCTIVTISKNGVVLAGNNEDFFEPRTKIWFYPVSKRKYGRVYVGYDRYLMPYQGGMNDQGLFLDMNAVNSTGWRHDPGKPNFDGCIIDHVLSHYATVDEVVNFFQQYNVPLDNVRVPVADAWGNSVIVEWAKGETQFVYKQGDYQISTNHVQSNYDNLDEYPCTRYKIADQILRNAETASIDLIRSVLSATHFEYLAQTLYSNICDLKRKRICLYHFHNFEEVVIFDLEDELKKGGSSYAIPSLFATKPFAAHLFEQIGPQVGAKELLRVINEQGIREGIHQFNEMKEQSRTFQRYVFEEWIFRDMGYRLLRSDRVEEAVDIFKLAAQLHPESWEVYDGLGEACRMQGDIAAAIENYERVLELDPANVHADKMLRTLKEGSP
jgi:tetratricopeptide (TPR) repeat protein